MALRALEGQDAQVPGLVRARLTMVGEVVVDLLGMVRLRGLLRRQPVRSQREAAVFSSLHAHRPGDREIWFGKQRQQRRRRATETDFDHIRGQHMDPERAERFAALAHWHGALDGVQLPERRQVRPVANGTPQARRCVDAGDILAVRPFRGFQSEQVAEAVVAHAPAFRDARRQLAAAPDAQQPEVQFAGNQALSRALSLQGVVRADLAKDGDTQGGRIGRIRAAVAAAERGQRRGKRHRHQALAPEADTGKD
nr:hypothetical protein [Hankyongella ginsenosidimutans]